MDKTLQQLEILASNGVSVRLIKATYFRVSAFNTWFNVNTELQSTTDCNGHSDAPYTHNTLAECLVIRFHARWKKTIENENTYISPPIEWCTLFKRYKLPYKLKLV